RPISEPEQGYLLTPTHTLEDPHRAPAPPKQHMTGLVHSTILGGTLPTVSRVNTQLQHLTLRAGPLSSHHQFQHQHLTFRAGPLSSHHQFQHQHLTFRAGPLSSHHQFQHQHLTFRTGPHTSHHQFQHQRLLLRTGPLTSHHQHQHKLGFEPTRAEHNVFPSGSIEHPLCDEVAEWLRRWTANPLCSARVGSNPILVRKGPQVLVLAFSTHHSRGGHFRDYITSVQLL